MEANATQRAATPGDIATSRRRRPAHDRRQQLLDAAGRVLLERGRAGFTMEAIAAEAGVSKALPYRHFTNGDDALRALFRREIGALITRLTVRTANAASGEEALTLMVDEYFRAIEERGALLSVLAGPGSDVPETTGGGSANRRPPDLLVGALGTFYGLGRSTAVPLASLLMAIVVGASESAGRGEMTMRAARRLSLDAALGTVERVVGRRERLSPASAAD